MKKALLAGLVCAGAAITRSSYGNGTIIFDNYVPAQYMPIEYSSNHVGVADSDYHVDLLYAFGTQSTTNGMRDLGLSVAIDPTIKDLVNGNYGYFEDGVVTIPGYSSGPVTFDIVCWLTATEGRFGGYANYGLAAASDNGVIGHSFVWTESSLGTGLFPPNSFTWPGPYGAPLMFVAPVPEPSIFAFTGLGFAALMLKRRRTLSSSAKISAD